MGAHLLQVIVVQDLNGESVAIILYALLDQFERCLQQRKRCWTAWSGATCNLAPRGKSRIHLSRCERIRRIT